MWSAPSEAGFCSDMYYIRATLALLLWVFTYHPCCCQTRSVGSAQAVVSTDNSSGSIFLKQFLMSVARVVVVQLQICYAFACRWLQDLSPPPSPSFLFGGAVLDG